MYILAKYQIALVSTIFLLSHRCDVFATLWIYLILEGFCQKSVEFKLIIYYCAYYALTVLRLNVCVFFFLFL